MDTSIKNKPEMVNVEISGRKHQVPAGITAVKAVWYTGQAVTRGIGCLGGVCGACSILYRIRGNHELQYGLGCQLVVEEGMSFSFAPHIPSSKATYHLEEIKDPKQELVKYYPEAALCRNCNTCTEACPQGIDVRSNIWRAVFGEFKQVMDETLNCVMCSLCIPVCIADISPNLVFLYARRTYNHFYEKKAPDLAARLAEIQEGKYQSEWDTIIQLDEKGLNQFCLSKS
ncbi:MAG: 4Fe-4S dicluster domain-containing protein [Nitrospiria bacterium]